MAGRRKEKNELFLIVNFYNLGDFVSLWLNRT